MEIDEKKVGDVLVVLPREKRIDASVSTGFKGRMVDWINQGNRRIVLDLSQVDFIDSSGLGAIVSSLKTLGTEGDLVICGIRETVMGLFKITRMNRVFQIFANESEAIEALSR
ncbi:MAG: Anti-sigma-B factor antagonist [Syntrophorhabdus sp. PtaB.Bin047]|jgi:anti-sigma B factor antagonist|nr:MAG: Anti-sigma-B factor antagonist [Syntrophorhabdus sp. PtaB.Bin047]